MELSFIRDENAVEQVDGITYEFPYTMHERDLTNFTVPWHWHEELEFDYVCRGSIEIETVNKTYTIHQGEAYFINTNVMNTKRKGEGSASSIEHAHIFHPLLLTGHYKSIYETRYMNPVLKNQSLEILIIRENTASGKEFLKILHNLTRINGQEKIEFEVRNLLSRAWLILLDEIQQQKELFQPLYVHERAKDILSFIHKHYGEKITIAEIAAYIGVSSKECIRSFKNMFHQTPIDYLIHYRIERAKKFLLETNSSITEIAYMTGFQSSAYFTKIFRKYTGMTPKEFRQSI